MNQSAELLEKTIQSKEYKNLSKCAQKNCDKYAKIMEKEQIAISKLSLLTTNDSKSFLVKAKEISALTKQIAQINMDKEALICTFTQCATEVANLNIKKNKLAIELIDNADKLLDDALKKIAKHNK